nr:YicC family protein [Desulfobulbaceae bacterium]
MKKILSMTGFGRGEAGNPDRRWNVEIRSVNHKFCDVKIKIARKYMALEEKIKKQVTSLFTRGHFEITVTVSGTQAETVALTPNLALAKAYHDSLITIKNELGLSQAPDLKTIADFKDVITYEEVPEDMDHVWSELSLALDDALDSLLKMRSDEGQALKNDLMERIDSFSQTIQSIEKHIPDLIIQRKAALEERLINLLGTVDMDPTRFNQEVAILADKSDVTEELVRLNSHIMQFKSFMVSEEAVGRRLDFLLQEFLREINTMASKISDATILHKTVDLKNEVEKIREQAANIE